MTFAELWRVLATLWLNNRLSQKETMQSLLEPVEHTPDTQEVVVEPRYANIYSSFVKALAVAKPYEPIDLSEYDKMSNVTQRTYRANICKGMPNKSVQFTHSTGNCKGD